MLPKRSFSDAEMMVSQHKNSKKAKALCETDDIAVLEGQTIGLMLEEHTDTFGNMESYAKDLLQTRSIEYTSPKTFLKMLLLEGWLDEEERVFRSEGDKIHIWKQIKAYNIVV